MLLSEFAQSVEGFARLGHCDKIQYLAWFLHVHSNRDRLMPSDIGRCYDELHLQRPASFGPYIKQLKERSPKVLLQDKGGYRLETHAREKLDATLGKRASAVALDALIAG